MIRRKMPGVGVLFLCHHFGRSFVSILFLLTELRSRAKKGRSQRGFTGREQYTKVLYNIFGRRSKYTLRLNMVFSQQQSSSRVWMSQ